jgi:hypothetical protein
MEFKIKKIILLLSLIFIVSCQKKEDKKAEIFLKGINEVKLYSYPSRMMWDTINGRSNSNLKFEKGKLIFDKTKVIDSLVLSNDQKDKVFNILLDTKWEEKGMQAACYEPRHLFLFYKDNKLVGYYEVCLECGGWLSSKELDDLPMFCIEKGDELKELFVKMNLKNIGEEH